MKRTGIADLPLHGGKAPYWLTQRMTKLLKAMLEVMLSEYTKKEIIRRFSNPFWFQSLGNLLGFDWHSSGLTTTVSGALSKALSEMDYPIMVAGGKGRRATKTPEEIKLLADRKGLRNPENLIESSRITARVDSILLQDGYNLYHHLILFDEEGNWSVIQQGMNPLKKTARRYHWFSQTAGNYHEEPHSGISGKKEKITFNLTHRKSRENKKSIVALFKEANPHSAEKDLIKALKAVPHLKMPERFSVKLRNPENIHKILLQTYRKIIEDGKILKDDSWDKAFLKLLKTKGLGPASMRALSMTAWVIYGKKPAFSDPAVFSYAHGGKDGTPYPVNRDLYDSTIEFLEKIALKAKLYPTEKNHLLRRLANLEDKNAL